MLPRSSDMRRVRLSRFFICFSWSFLRMRAMNVFRGMDTIMIATPTNAGQPRMLYRETNARMIYVNR